MWPNTLDVFKNIIIINIFIPHTAQLLNIHLSVKALSGIVLEGMLVLNYNK